MNNNRRKELTALRTRLENIQSEFEAIRDDLETLKGEEEEYRDNMPESLQSGEKGQVAESAIDAMQNAYDELDGFDFDSVLGYLDTASE